MICEYLGRCGSCFYFDKDYQEQLDIKVAEVKEQLKPFYSGDFKIYQSSESNFRARAEFRVYRQEGAIFYAMNDMDKKLLPIQNCPKVLKPIEKLFTPLLEKIAQEQILSFKLFSIEFLSGLSQEVLVTLIYHKRLDSQWVEAAKALEDAFGISVIGRSRKQKEVLSKDFIIEKLQIDKQSYLYKHYESSFTQPNPKVNEKMIQWAIEHADKKGDLLESYCGAGNFTIPLAKYYNNVLATEISKKSIHAAKDNCSLNGVENIEFVRLSSQELTQALNKEREFVRLKGVDLTKFAFSTVLVDPPRAGLDEATKILIGKIDQIIYISCNPQTLSRDLETLLQTHEVKEAAVFDQFAYSKHIESAVILKKKEYSDGL